MKKTILYMVIFELAGYLFDHLESSAKRALKERRRRKRDCGYEVRILENPD